MGRLSKEENTNPTEHNGPGAKSSRLAEDGACEEMKASFRLYSLGRGQPGCLSVPHPRLTSIQAAYIIRIICWSLPIASLGSRRNGKGCAEALKTSPLPAIKLRAGRFVVRRNPRWSLLCAAPI